MKLEEATKRVTTLVSTEPEAWRVICDELTERPQYPENRKHPCGCKHESCIYCNIKT